MAHLSTTATGDREVSKVRATMPPQTNQDSTSSVIEADLQDRRSSKVRKEIIYEGEVYDVTEWVDRHPGGRIIEFYTQSGEDSTLAIQQFHNRSMLRVAGLMKSMKRSQATGTQLTQEPSTDGATPTTLSPETRKRHEALTKDFQALHKSLEDEGLFRPSPWHVAYRLFELATLYLVGLYLWNNGGDNKLLLATAVGCSAMFGGRCGWLMHEGGHHSLTGRPKLDRFLQSFIFGYGSGMSAAWWSSQHNRHHAMPQRLQHDVDLDTLPLLAFNARVSKNPKKDANSFLIQNQSKLFLLVDCFLVAWFWKLYLHPRYCIKKGAYSDLFFMAVHYFVMSNTMGLLPYLLATWLTSIYIFGNFALSHTHLPVTDEPLHWVEYSFLHTMDVQPGPICNWWMCYLNFQIEHHLFPTMPQFRHPQVSKRVQELAQKHGLPYRVESYWDAAKRTYDNLAHVSEDMREMCVD